MVAELRPHPFAEKTRDYTTAELERLTESIRRTGRVTPIKVWRGQIVAGRHRWQAAQAAGWEPADIPKAELPDDLTDGDLRLEVLADEDVRRHSTASQRRQFITRLYDDVVPKELSPGKPKKDIVASATIKSVSEVAEVTGQSRADMTRAFQLERSGREDLKAEVEAGKMTDRRAVQEMNREEKAEAAREKAEKVPASDRFQVFPCGVAELAREVDAGSVDLVFCDPPYEKDGLPLFSDLAEFCGHALRDGGSALVMTGSMWLPEVLERLTSTEELNYQWLFVYQMGKGPASQVHPRNVLQAAKTIVWLVKGKYEGVYVRDLIEHPSTSKKETGEVGGEWHKWGQTEAGAAAVLTRFLDADKGGEYAGGGGV